MTMAELQEYATFNREFADAVRAAKKAGQSVEEVVKTLDDAGEVPGLRRRPPEARLRSNAQVIYDEIDAIKPVVRARSEARSSQGLAFGIGAGCDKNWLRSR